MTDEQKKIVEENHKLIFDYLWRHHYPIEEYYDLAAIGLCKAAMTYDGESSKFSTYAYTCMRNEIIRYQQKWHRGKAIPDGLILSIDMPVLENEESSTLANTLASSIDIEGEIINDITVTDIMSKLNDREKTVVYLRMRDYSYRQIAKVLGVSCTRVGHIINEIRAKILKII